MSLVALILVVLAGPPAARAADGPPNIVFIVAEDISPDLGCYGNAFVRTPNLDRLAAQGARFTRCFTHAPVCAPSRSGMITGRYPTAFGTHHMRSKLKVDPPPTFTRGPGHGRVAAVLPGRAGGAARPGELLRVDHGDGLPRRRRAGRGREIGPGGEHGGGVLGRPRARAAALQAVGVRQRNALPGHRAVAGADRARHRARGLGRGGRFRADVPRHRGGAGAGGLDGQAFVAAKGKPLRAPRRHVYAARDRMDETPDRIRSVRDERYRYVRNYRPELPYAQVVRYGELMPTMRVWRQWHAEGKLSGPQTIFYSPPKPDEELYDTAADPHDVNNLAASTSDEHRRKLKELRAQLDGWIAQTKDLGAVPEDELVRRGVVKDVRSDRAAPAADE